MAIKLSAIILLSGLCVTLALPVTVKKVPAPQPQEPVVEPNPTDNLHYDRYLKEVVDVLESDPDFRQKLDTASAVDIRSGQIAHELEFVNHNVRSKLDEIKRKELDRLRDYANLQYRKTNEIDVNHLKIADHVDHANADTFEIDDLKKLIKKTAEDLAAADEQRKEEFKQYEMQKEFEKQEHLKTLDEQHKAEFEENLQKQHEKHNKHEKIHYPGHKPQLEEVWEKQDHMEGQDFDPKTFFMMHDHDSNGFWDENEVRALFIQELNKLYESGASQDDMRERREEMERMREEVFKKADLNHDDLISYDEFIAETKRDEFERDQNWETVDQAPQFTHDEYIAFDRQRQEEIKRLIDQGALPPHPNMPHGYYQDQMKYHGQPVQQQYHQGQQAPPQPQQHYQQQYQQQPHQQVQQHLQQGQQFQVPPAYQQQPGQAAPPQHAYQHPGAVVPPQQLPVAQQINGGQVPVAQQINAGQVPVAQVPVAQNPAAAAPIAQQAVPNVVQPNVAQPAVVQQVPVAAQPNPVKPQIAPQAQAPPQQAAHPNQV